MLISKGIHTQVLDGDELRRELCSGLGFSRQDRDENVRRIAFVAGLLARNGIVAIVAAISPYRAARDQARQKSPAFLEVYVNAPLEVCEQRDTKGLYKKARNGEITGLTGVDDPYEVPLNADIECRTDIETIEESCQKVLSLLDQRLA